MAAPNFSSVDDTLGLYNYSPNMPAAVVGTLSFTAISMIHLWKFSRHQSWCFLAMIAGVLVECIGFGARIVSIYHPTHTGPFFTSYIAFLLAPSLILIACCITFSRIMWWITPSENSQISIIWCKLRFVSPVAILISSTVSFFTLLGGGMIASTYQKKNLSEELSQGGLATLKTGLFLQLIGLAAFTTVALRFMFVSRSWDSNSRPSAMDSRPTWRQLAWAIVLAIILLTFPSVYRIAELYSSLGSSLSYLALYEWPFWVLHTVPMLVLCILVGVIHPGQYLPSDLLSYMRRHGETKDTLLDY